MGMGRTVSKDTDKTVNKFHFEVLNLKEFHNRLDSRVAAIYTFLNR